MFRVCSLLFVLMLTSDVTAQSYWHRREDYLHFRSMIADIRRPVHHMRMYSDPPVRFTNPKQDDNRSWWDSESFPPIWRRGDDEHRFWDVAFGGKFNLIGYLPDIKEKEKVYDPSNPGVGGKTPMRIRGTALFLEPAVHMLLDFNANSNAVINADFRIGAGLASRSVPILDKVDCLEHVLRHFAWRFKIFHECTHLGDEFILDALLANRSVDPSVIQPDPPVPENPELLQRYNVSYDPIDLYLAFDNYERGGRPLYAEDDFYWRLYYGHRWLRGMPEHKRFLRYNPDLGEAETLNRTLKTGTREQQFGLEYMNRLSHAKWAPNPNVLIHLMDEIGKHLITIFTFGHVHPNYVMSPADFAVVAAEFYRRPLYSITESEMTTAFNLVLGLMWGNYFVANHGGSSLGFQLNYYNGPNPHGQFRDTKIKYWGLDLVVGF